MNMKHQIQIDAITHYLESQSAMEQDRYVAEIPSFTLAARRVLH
jgi:uncharacterized protein affecting Mg2+/Co2+ transport